MDIPMYGSGTLASEHDFDLNCPKCDHEWADTLSSDDYQNYDQDVTCPKCEAIFEFTFEREEY